MKRRSFFYNINYNIREIHPFFPVASDNPLISKIIFSYIYVNYYPYQINSVRYSLINHFACDSGSPSPSPDFRKFYTYCKTNNLTLHCICIMWLKTSKNIDKMTLPKLKHGR